MSDNQNSQDGLYDDETNAQRVDAAPQVAEPVSAAGNLAKLTKDKKSKRVIMFTLGAVMVAVLGIIVVISAVTRPKTQVLPQDARGAVVGAPPGQMIPDTDKSAGKTQQFGQVVEGVSARRVEEAKQEGTSVQPMAVTIERDLQAAPPPPAVVRQEQVALQPTQPDPAYLEMMNNARAAVKSLARSRELGTAIYDAPARRNETVAGNGVVNPSVNAGLVNTAQSGAQGGQQTANANSLAGNQAKVTLIRAGQMESVRLDTGINSKVAGEFIGTVLTGPHAGARVVGTAQRHDDLVRPTFSMMSVPNLGYSLPIKAIGVDAQTLENGTATDVDRKLFLKYGVQPLAVALSAVGSAMTSSGTTVIINGNGTQTTSTPEMTASRARGIALGAAAGAVSKDAAGFDTEPVVKVAPGTIIGMIFLADVTYNRQ